jgi:hypothetical protein
MSKSDPRSLIQASPKSPALTREIEYELLQMTLHGHSDLSWAIRNLLEKGLIVDSGKRRNGKIVYIASEFATKH